MAKRNHKPCVYNHIQVRRLGKQWYVCIYWNYNWYQPKCTGCISCQTELGQSRGWQCNPNKVVKGKTLDILSVCKNRSDANRAADELVRREEEDMHWYGVFDSE